MTQSQIAKKAVHTRQARDTFRKAYSPDTYVIIEGLHAGLGVKDIAKITGHSIGSIAAIKANLTRGTYDKLLKGCKI
jgi:hypothetical protein